MATKLYDVIVAVSKYTDQSGQEKRKWENIGAIWQDTDNNGNVYKFAMLKRTFNPAGIEVREGADSIRLTLTPPKPKEQQGQGQPAQQYGYGQSQYQQAPQFQQQQAPAGNFTPITDNGFDPGDMPF